jgi:glycosyltransferase involved in cell wall biosynthesis
MSNQGVNSENVHGVHAFLIVRNERSRVPCTLNHHRSLGIRKFFVVDNGSSDSTFDYLSSQADVRVTRTNASYREARNGMAWIEQLLDQYAMGRWCLVIDADEYLVYPHSEQTDIATLCHQLDNKGLNCLATMFIDMYGSLPITRTVKRQREDLLNSCPYLDRCGYFNIPLPQSTFPRIFGGPRSRLFWPDLDIKAQDKLLLRCAADRFDEGFYLTKYPDVGAAVDSGEFKSGWQHYRLHGHSQNRSFRLKEISFDESYYCEAYPDVQEAIKSHHFRDGWHHYRLYGHAEGRKFRLAEPGFNESAYLAFYPDVVLAIKAGHVSDGWHHYCRYGYEERRVFNAIVPPPQWPEQEYLTANPDIRESIDAGVVASAYEHYLGFGQFEGRLLGYPPLLSQIPLIKWERGMKIHAGRHAVEGARWSRSEAIGGALLHFKLMSDLVDRAKAVKSSGEDTSESPHWGTENTRYHDVLTKDPKLRARERWSGFKKLLARGREPSISVRYRNSQQLVELGLITPTGQL